MKTKCKRQTSLTTWAAVALLASNFATAANPADVRGAFSKVGDAAEFADHVEDGLKISRTVNRVQDVAEGGNVAGTGDGDHASKVVKHGKDVVESVTASAEIVVSADIAKEAASEVTQAVFAEVIEDEVQDQVLDQGRKAVRKAILP